MTDIEVEVKVFLNEEEYHRLLEFFHKEGEFLGDEEQITYYFGGDDDMRIQKNKFFSKLILKKGKVHDEQRQEFEVPFAREDFHNLEKLFLALGHKVEIQWFRKRNSFSWKGLLITVDDTKGYGKILELEKMASEREKDEVLDFLKNKVKELDLTVTPRDEFEERFQYYKENWQNLI